ILQADSTIIREKPQIMRLFIHEAQRVFHDRLINNEDKMFFHNIMAEMTAKHFNESVEPKSFVTSPILFGNFIKMGCVQNSACNKLIFSVQEMSMMISVINIFYVYKGKCVQDVCGDPCVSD
ncbi:unnamed protein product, partial [Candidula unifasciata]